MERTEFNALQRGGGYYEAHFGQFNNHPNLAQDAKGDWDE
jgi:hypothetical protein